MRKRSVSPSAKAPATQVSRASSIELLDMPKDILTLILGWLTADELMLTAAVVCRKLQTLCLEKTVIGNSSDDDIFSQFSGGLCLTAYHIYNAFSSCGTQTRFLRILKEHKILKLRDLQVMSKVVKDVDARDFPPSYNRSSAPISVRLALTVHNADRDLCMNYWQIEHLFDDVLPVRRNEPEFHPHQILQRITMEYTGIEPSLLYPSVLASRPYVRFINDFLDQTTFRHMDDFGVHRVRELERDPALSPNARGMFALKHICIKFQLIRSWKALCAILVRTQPRFYCTDWKTEDDFSELFATPVQMAILGGVNELSMSIFDLERFTPWLASVQWEDKDPRRKCRNFFKLQKGKCLRDFHDDARRVLSASDHYSIVQGGCRVTSRRISDTSELWKRTRRQQQYKSINVDHHPVKPGGPSSTRFIPLTQIPVVWIRSAILYPEECDDDDGSDQD